jgi:hypothetical protein
VRAFAQRAAARSSTDRARISQLLTAVRDEIRYDPYGLSYDPQDYVASNVPQLHDESGPALRACSDLSETASTLTMARIRPGIGASDRVRGDTVVGAPWPRTSAVACKQAGIGAADYSSTPDAAVRAVPARVLLSCLLFRSSWLTAEDDRHFGAARVLHRRGGRAAWPCGSVWLLAFRSSRVRSVRSPS